MKNRISFVTRGKSILVLSTVLFSSYVFSQNLQCNDFIGGRTCTAGILYSILDDTKNNYDPQHQNEWCWAASIEAVFKYYGHYVPQERIVTETFGSLQDWPAQPYTILAALNKTWTDEEGNRFTVRAESYDASYSTAAQDLASNCPLIIGALGHAMVLTAITYTGYTNGQIFINSLTVRDPWPLNPKDRNLTGQEWMGISFCARIRCFDN